MFRPLIWLLLGSLVSQSVYAQSTGISINSQAPNRAHSDIPALLIAQSRYEEQPTSTNALLAYLAALREARLPSVAYMLAQQHPNPLPSELLRELKIDYAAELTRLALAPTRA